MILENISKILFFGILWSVFAEIVTKLTPIPKKLLQIEDKAERS